MTRLKLSYASPAYDRNESLISGEVKPEGIDLNYLVTAPQEAHARMLRNQEFDISDMSLSFYMITKLTGKANFTAIPVFPMRKFFHTDLIVNVDSGIKSPSDLKGKRIGVPEYVMTLALWLRGILKHEYGIGPSDVEWYIERQPGDRVSDIFGFQYPTDVPIHQISKESDIMSMLEKGEIDVAFPQFRFWKTFRDRSKLGSIASKKVKLLFQDQKAESMRYFRKTGIFPINHTVVIRNEILKENPWVAVSLYEALQTSKEKSYEKMDEKMREPSNYIWLDDLTREVRDVFGKDTYPYGIKKNEKILDTITTYSHEQGLSPRKASVEDLFFHTTLNL